MNNYLETGIAVVLILLLFSIVVYVIQELIAANLQFRGKMLKESINQLLSKNINDEKDPLFKDLFAHPQINLLRRNLKNLTAYIPSSNFAMAVMDIIADKADTKTNDLFTDIKAGIAKLEGNNADFKKLAQTWLNNSTNVKELKEQIEKWFNEYMERVTGWYKRKYAVVTRTIAVLVALGFNLDIIRITETIYNDDQLRTTLVATADRLADQPETVKAYYTSTINAKLAAVDSITAAKIADSAHRPEKDTLQATAQRSKDSIIANYNQDQIRLVKSLIDSAKGDRLVFGWHKSSFKVNDAGTERPVNGFEIFVMLIGLAIGALAISFGAPFWFDVLVKLVNVRRAGIKPKEAGK